MLVSDDLLAAAMTDPHLAYELITGWSYSAGKQLGGNAIPGMWMTGNAMRLMERTRSGVLHVDLLACQSYAGGLDAAAAVRCPVLAILGARDLMTPVKGAQALLAALADQRTLTLPDTGHAMMAEQPDAVLDARAFHAEWTASIPTSNWQFVARQGVAEPLPNWDATAGAVIRHADPMAPAAAAPVLARARRWQQLRCLGNGPRPQSSG
jgi:hypothetical protein